MDRHRNRPASRRAGRILSDLPPLDEDHVDADPVAQFVRWFDDAGRAGVPEPEAMCLATVGPDGPSARMVLLKGVDERGFVFYTNYGSRKGRELAGTPSAALVFRWFATGRQVRVTGRAEQVDEADSDAYFASRDRGSQLGAWASEQSTVVASRQVLDDRLAEMRNRFDGQAVARPPWWGGIRIVPDTVELWQNRPDRMHDRLRYTRVEGFWQIVRLAP
jgi:pyridoxamine 5'-phosphate oxidase